MSPVAVSLSVLKGAVKENSAVRGPSPQPAGSVVDGRAENCTLQRWRGRRREGSEHTGHGWCGAGGVRAQSCCHQALRAVLLLPLGPMCSHLCSCQGLETLGALQEPATSKQLPLSPFLQGHPGCGTDGGHGAGGAGGTPQPHCPPAVPQPPLASPSRGGQPLSLGMATVSRAVIYLWDS